jgi:hypothetical protein
MMDEELWLLRLFGSVQSHCASAIELKNLFSEMTRGEVSLNTVMIYRTGKAHAACSGQR